MENMGSSLGSRKACWSSFQPISCMNDLQGVEAGLLGGVAEIGDGELVFGVVERGEVDGLGEVGVDVLPLGDELFVDGVELVGFAGEGSGSGPRCGEMSSSQFHWMTAASRSEVGVSALYSRSLGAGPLALRPS